MKILVIGGTGLIGTHVVDAAIQRGHEVSWTYFSSDIKDISHAHQLDKTEVDAVNHLINKIKPDAVIDSAAFVDVDACEMERERTWAVNVSGSRNVAVASNKVGAHLLTFSTDYVFRGDPESAPYEPQDPINPQNYYGVTKYAAEGAARIVKECTILRTSVVYSVAPANFVMWALSELEMGHEISIVNDQVSTPTFATDLALASIEILERRLKGIFHAAGPKSMSRYAFTRLLADTFGYNPMLVRPISTAELKQNASRPPDGSLDSVALYDRLGWPFSGPQEAFFAMRENS